MFAIKYDTYGDPDVLSIGEAPEPHAGAHQVRIQVRASAVNPIDAKLRSGALKEMMPLTFPMIPGTEASGVVDEIGANVTGVQVGDEVFGLGRGTSAEFAVLDHFAVKPSQLDWDQAAGMAAAAETAARVLATIDLTAGQTLLINNAAGSAGSAIAQFAIDGGLVVVGTASAANHARLSSLGVTPVTYGPGLPQRLASAGVSRVDGAIDAAAQFDTRQLIGVVGDASKVVSLNDFSAPTLGAKFSTSPAAYDGLPRAVTLVEAGRYMVAVDRRLPFSDAAHAHRLSEAGHLRGKLVLSL
jgi:NADPH:quinone reductase-like Zn-dependent oxidoreductase